MPDFEDEYEEVDALPVLSGPGETPVLEPSPAGSRSLRERVGGDGVVQVAAVATAGFAVGAATMAVARHRGKAKAPKRKALPKAARAAAADIVATRRFVVDVHLLGD